MNSEEQFEAWFALKFPKINEKASDPSDPVRGQVKEVARYAWKYSRETLAIELPKRKAPTSWESYDNAFNNTVNECQRAIEAAGVKVK